MVRDDPGTARDDPELVREDPGKRLPMIQDWFRMIQKSVRDDPGTVLQVPAGLIVAEQPWRDRDEGHISIPLLKCTVISVRYEWAWCQEGRPSGREEGGAARWIASNDRERSAGLVFSSSAQVSALRTSCALRQQDSGGQ